MFGSLLWALESKKKEGGIGFNLCDKKKSKARMARNYGGEKIDLKRMANHHSSSGGGGKKDPPKESLLHQHPEGTEEEIDKEWEEFSNLLEKYKDRKSNR